MSKKYPYNLPVSLTPGQRDGIDLLLSDTRYQPPGVTTRAALVRYAVEQIMIRSGMPLAPVAVDGEYSLSPVEPHEDTVQTKRRERMEAELADVEERSAALDQRERELAACRREYGELMHKHAVLRRQWRREAEAGGFAGPDDDGQEDVEHDQEHDTTTGRRPLGAGPGEEQ